jgi:hypothetical protein
MATGKDYPRQAAHTLRQGRRAQAELAQSRAQTALEQARSSVVDADRALQQQVASASGSDPAQGPTSGHMLQRQAAFGERQARQTRKLRALLQQAEANEMQAAAEYTRAQQLLADAHTAEQVLDRDRDRFGVEQRKSSVRADELEAEEHRPTGRPPRER